MNQKTECCPAEHQGHLCVLASKEAFDAIQPLVRDPRFICFNCGRVAHSERHLCNPMPLEPAEQSV